MEHSGQPAVKEFKDFLKQLSTSTFVINSACAKFPRFSKTKVKIL